MWQLVKSHLRKGKFGFIVVALLATLSIMMMVIGLSICLELDTVYARKLEKDHAPDALFEVSGFQENEAERFDAYFLENFEMDGVAEWEKETSYRLAAQNLQEGYLSFSDGNKGVSMNGSVIREYDVSSKYRLPLRSVRTEGEGFKLYLSGWLANKEGYQLGNTVEINHKGRIYTGYVAGIVESTSRLYWYEFFVESDFFQTLKDDQVIVSDGVLYQVTYKDRSVLELDRRYDVFQQLIIDYQRENAAPDKEMIDWDYCDWSIASKATLPYITLLGAALVGFSVLTALICCIVILFLVRSSITDEVRNLGVLKSLGYTTRQIRMSYLAVYAVVIGVALLLGIVLGISLMPAFVNIITMMTYLQMSVPLNAWAVLLSIVFTPAIILITVYLTTVAVKRITPLSALRNNLSQHNFKRNRMPLARSRMPVNVALGVKSVVGERGRSVTVGVIVGLMSILCAFVSVVYYNLKVDQTALIQLSGVEQYDFILGIGEENPDDYFDQIARMEHFEGMTTNATYRVLLNDYGVITIELYGSYDYKRTNVLYRGEYPKNTDEIVVSAKIAEKMGKQIGDMITIVSQHFDYEKGDYTDTSVDCLIVGLTQKIGQDSWCYGLVSLLDSLGNHYTNFSRAIYFEKGYVPESQEINKLLINYKKSLGLEGNFKFNGFMTGEGKLRDEILNVVEPACDAIVGAIIAISAIVIAVLLAMLIKLKVLREKRRYALYKALGYTGIQIMSQISVTMLVLSLIGSIAGGLLGGLLSAPFLSLIGSFLGLVSMNFTVNVGYIVLVVVMINVLVYAFSMLFSLGIRRIRPATMLKERD